MYETDAVPTLFTEEEVRLVMHFEKVLALSVAALAELLATARNAVNVKSLISCGSL